MFFIFNKKILALLLFMSLFIPVTQAEPPLVSNVQATQRTDGSKIVDITYDVEDVDTKYVKITVLISDNDGISFDITPITLSGDVGLVQVDKGKHITWDAVKDAPGKYGTEYRAAVTADDNAPPAGETIQVSISKPLEMVFIPAGSFMMGSPSNEKDRYGDEVQHKVEITEPFYIGKYEVTQAQWQSVMGNYPAKDFGVGNDFPVYNVSWTDCNTFIQKLNQTGQGTFRLPTEAEWEYACRAGTTTRYYWGDDPNDQEIKQYAWYDGNKTGSTKRIGTKLPNAWGIFDMSGNVWEWCKDWYGNYSTDTQTNPTGANTGSKRVFRGGGWNDLSKHCRSSLRSNIAPDFSGNNLGFRLVKSYP